MNFSFRVRSSAFSSLDGMFIDAYLGRLFPAVVTAAVAVDDDDDGTFLSRKSSSSFRNKSVNHNVKIVICVIS